MTFSAQYIMRLVTEQSRANPEIDEISTPSRLRAMIEYISFYS